MSENSGGSGYASTKGFISVVSQIKHVRTRDNIISVTKQYHPHLLCTPTYNAFHNFNQSSSTILYQKVAIHPESVAMHLQCGEASCSRRERASQSDWGAPRCQEEGSSRRSSGITVKPDNCQARSSKTWRCRPVPEKRLRRAGRGN